MGRWSTVRPHRLPALVLALLLLFAAAPALADQNAPELDGLFRDLKTAETPQQVRRIEAQIWSHWFTSDSQDINDMFQAGSAMLATRRFDVAHRIFDRIVQRRPDLSEGWNRRATVRYLMGDYEGSIADIDETLKREPRHFGALSGLGLCHLALGNHEEALAALERALVHNPHMQGVRQRAEHLRTLLGREEI